MTFRPGAAFSRPQPAEAGKERPPSPAERPALIVGMGELKSARGSDLLMTLGLGSCIGLCAYDPAIRAAAMAHIILPDSSSVTDEEAGDELPAKFADRAVPALVAELERLGAIRGRLRTAIVGGAQIFQFHQAGPRLEVGRRNAAAVRAALETLGLPLRAEEVGGSQGRTCRLYASDGRVAVRTIGGGERELVVLGDGGQ